MSTRDLPDDTIWQRERPVDSLEYNWQGNILAGANHELVNLQYHDAELQRFVFSSDNHLVYAEIRFYTAAGAWTDYLQVPAGDGSTKHYGGALVLRLYPSDIFDILMYDLDQHEFKISLNRVLRAANGIRIRIVNADAAPHNVAVEASILDRGVKF